MFKTKMLSIVPAAALALSTVTAFAVGEVAPPLPTIAITTEMLQPIVSGVVANIAVILPVGIGLFAITVGVRMLPNLITRFLHM